MLGESCYIINVDVTLHKAFLFSPATFGPAGVYSGSSKAPLGTDHGKINFSEMMLVLQ
jgi:hypothetical protein